MIPEYLTKDWKGGERKAIEEYIDDQLLGRPPEIQRLIDLYERRKKSKINQAK